MKEESQKTTGEKWLEIGLFGWLIKYQTSNTWLDFQAYKAIAIDLDGKEKYFVISGSSKWTTDTSIAECISGYVKWDGCMETDLPTNHYCGKEDVQDFCNIMMELHKLCLLIPNVDKECAGYTK